MIIIIIIIYDNDDYDNIMKVHSMKFSNEHSLYGGYVFQF